MGDAQFNTAKSGGSSDGVNTVILDANAVAQNPAPNSSTLDTSPNSADTT